MEGIFKIECKSSDCKARAGFLNIAGLSIETPVFMPVGTQGTVKAVYHRDLLDSGANIILGNTYHLYIRPGVEVIEHFGGLHKFINWKKVILTDSGGYQIFSLQDLRKLTNDGVEFRSHVDGTKIYFSPENVVQTQRAFGSDIIMVLDECTPYPSTFEQAADSMEMSINWAARAKKEFINSSPLYDRKQYLFGIGQGGMYPDLRKICIKKLIDIDFDGYAIGGLSVGEPPELMYEMTDISTDELPENRPRYLMGVGTPENILESVERGIDMFDCVVPTRNARNGQLFTTRGKINIKNAQYKLSDEPIDPEIESYPSRNFSLGYLRHLIMAGEITGLQIASHHNIAFYQWLMREARMKILSNEYRLWKTIFLEKYNQNND